MSKGRIDFWTIIKIVVFAILILFMVYPFSALIIRSFLVGDEFSLENYQNFASLRYYYRTLFHSLSVSTSSTFFAVLIGVPLAYAVSRYNVWGKRLITILIIMSLMSPPFIGAYSWIMLLGRSGIISKFFEQFGIRTPTIYGWFGIVLVFTLKLFPFVYLYVSGALSSIDRSLEEAAENLGANRIYRLLTITFPVIMPTIAAGAIIVFMSSLADFGTPMLIGEGYKVLPVLVYEEYMSEIGGNANMASALSVIVVICSTTVLLVQKYVVSKKNYMMTALRPPIIIELKWPGRLALSLVCFLTAFIAFLPQVVVVITSFVKTNGPIFVKGWSLDSYRSILYKLSRNITNTFLYSSIAIIFIVLMGMFIAYLLVKRKDRTTELLDVMVMFPYVIPGAVLGISLLVAFNKQPFMLAGTPIILIVAYIVRKMPYTVRSSSAILYQIDPSIEEASINLGVSPMKTFFKITAVMMAPGVLSGAILSWISTINELSSSVMLYTGRTATISVAIYTEVSRSSYGTAAALASILTGATIISLLIFMWISKGKTSVI